MTDAADVPDSLLPTVLDVRRLFELGPDDSMHSENGAWSVHCYGPTRRLPHTHFFLLWDTARTASLGGEEIPTAKRVVDRLRQLAEHGA